MSFASGVRWGEVTCDNERVGLVFERDGIVNSSFSWNEVVEGEES